MVAKLFRGSAIASLLFMALTCAWWFHSNGHVDEVTYDRHGQHTLKVWGSSGKLLLTSTAHPGASSTKLSQLSWGFNAPDSETEAQASKLSPVGVVYGQSLAGADVTAMLAVPAWFIISVLSLPPAVMMMLRGAAPKSGP